MLVLEDSENREFLERWRENSTHVLLFPQPTSQKLMRQFKQILTLKKQTNKTKGFDIGFDDKKEVIVYDNPITKFLSYHIAY